MILMISYLVSKKRSFKIIQNKNYQALIAFGGGSSIDLAKENDTNETNPLYPVPKLMDKEELKKFYY